MSSVEILSTKSKEKCNWAGESRAKHKKVKLKDYRMQLLTKEIQQYLKINLMLVP